MCNSSTNQNIADSAGFSLVELLVVIVMTGILATAGYSLFREQSRINLTQQNMLEIQSSARAAMQVLIHSFSHAGFGCSEKISGTNNVAGVSSFLNPSPPLANQSFNGTNPDSVIIVYGYEHVASVENNTSNSTTIPVDTSSKMGTTNYTRFINFFPSLSPNNFFVIQDVPSTTSIKIDAEISVTNATKIFRVNPIEYTVVDGILRERETAGIRDDAIIHNVQDFQLAYTEDDSDLDTLAKWRDVPTNPRNVKAVWIYMILRTEDPEPGHRETRTFSLPWDSTQFFNGADLPAGFHYQEFQTQVWLRNVN